MDELIQKNPDYFKHLSGTSFSCLNLNLKANAFAIKHASGKGARAREIRIFLSFYLYFKLYITILFLNQSQLFRIK